MDNKNKPNKKNNKKFSRNMLFFLVLPVVFILIIGLITSFITRENHIYSDVVNRFKRMEVVEYSLNLGTGDMEIRLNNGNTLRYNTPSVNLIYADIKEYVEKYNEQHSDAPIVYNLTKTPEPSWLINTFLFTLPSMILIGVLLWLIFKKIAVIGGDATRSFSFGKAKPKDGESKRKTTFESVAGADEEKEELSEVVDFLKSPKKYKDLGARIPKGVLLVGPPGTGKTLLARAVAGEADVPFFSMSGSDFVEMFVGVGASRVRDLFDKAKKNEPSVIFIDEIDAVGRRRGAGLGNGHDEREQTLNQFLVEMDGFSTNEGVIVLAATNRPDILDPALIRPGRFDRNVVVNYPDVKGREDILRVHAKGKPFDSDVKLKVIAKATAGFTGADLENLLNESALLAARKGKKIISSKEIEDSTAKVLIGTEKKSKHISEDQKKITAYHESGHAIVTFFSKTQDPVHEISIIPRGMAGGYTLSIAEKDRMYISRKQMCESISVTLGGRVAESIIFDEISTGASNDIEKATKTARQMVTKYGMSDSVGPICYNDVETSEFFLGAGHTKICSEVVAAQIDNEIKNIIKKCYEKSEQILKNNVDKLHEIAQYLIDNEKINGEQFKTLMTN